MFWSLQVLLSSTAFCFAMLIRILMYLVQSPELVLYDAHHLVVCLVTHVLCVSVATIEVATSHNYGHYDSRAYETVYTLLVSERYVVRCAIEITFPSVCLSVCLIEVVSACDVVTYVTAQTVTSLP